MINKAIQLILILLFIFTPIAFGSMEFWAFSLMELGILLIVVIWAIQNLFRILPAWRPGRGFGIWNVRPATPNPQSAIWVLLSLFLILILFQMVPIPSWGLKIISPKAYELRNALAIPTPQSEIHIPHSTISFMPFATKIEFFKWLTLGALFLFFLHWKFAGEGYRGMKHFVMVVFLMGVFESLYGMFEFFSGNGQLLHLKGTSAVTGTFTNRNYFAGYLVMAIPLSMGLFFSRDAVQRSRWNGWRHRLSSIEGKTLLMGFGIIVMILGLLFSGSRMGILSLLVSFTLISLLFRDPYREKRFSKSSVLILGLAVLWGVWIGLDAVVGRFLTVTEDFKLRWTIWTNTFAILKDFPILGSGLGTFGQVFPMYRSFHIRNLITHAENDFLQLASEVGLVGIGLLLILFVFLFSKGISGIRSLSKTGGETYLGIGGLVGILALMFHSLVERNLQVPANAFLYTFIFAMVLQAREGRDE